MAGYPLTAWALRHPWGDDVDALFDGLCDPSKRRARSPRRASELLEAVLAELGSRGDQARGRWGASRVAVLFGRSASGPAYPGSMTPESIRARLGVTGPAFGVDGGGAAAMASAHRLLHASVADAALVVAAEGDAAVLLMLERHGDAFVELRSSAEVTAPLDDPASEVAVRPLLDAAWSSVDEPPMGCVLLHAPAGHGAVKPALQAMLGSIPCVDTGTGALGAVDVVVAIAALLRGYVPGPSSSELAHDRVLTHAQDAHGHHVALLLEARA